MMALTEQPSILLFEMLQGWEIALQDVSDLLGPMVGSGPYVMFAVWLVNDGNLIQRESLALHYFGAHRPQMRSIYFDLNLDVSPCARATS